MALSAHKKAGSETVDKKPSDSGWYEASEVWTVRGATEADTRYTVVNCTDLPSIGTEDSEGVFCMSRSARKTENTSVWEVDVRYSSVSPSGLTPGYWTYEIPTERPPHYAWGTNHYDGVVSTASLTPGGAERVPVKNSAGDPYDPPIAEDLPRISLTATRYEADFNPLIIPYYVDRVAEDTFLGFAPYVTRCAGINADPHYENGVACHQVVYQFEFDENKWGHTVVDAGGRALNDDGVITVVGDGVGTDHGGLVLLDGTGHVLPQDDQASFVTYTYYNRYAVPFAPLGFTLQ